MSLENIKANGSSPLFSSYIAPYERSNYFVDEGYHLVYYDDHQPIRLVNENGRSHDFSIETESPVMGKLFPGFHPVELPEELHLGCSHFPYDIRDQALRALRIINEKVYY
jgi:hypothetical protein